MKTHKTLDSFSLVLAIRNAGSLMGGARELSVSHATAFRQLRRLEKELGVHLFERVSGRYTPSSVGLKMALIAEKIHQDTLHFFSQINGQDAKEAGEVTIAVPEALGSFLLLPMLNDFQKLYPEITIHLVFSNEVNGLNHRRADLAIYPMISPPQHLICKSMGKVSYAQYVRTNKSKSTSTTNEDLNWGVLDEAFLHHSTRRWIENMERKGRVVFRTNSLRGLCEAVNFGLCAGILPCFFGDQQKTLKRVAPPIQELTTELWLITHPDLRGVSRIAVLSQFLQTQLELRKPLFMGGEYRNL